MKGSGFGRGRRLFGGHVLGCCRAEQPSSAVGPPQSALPLNCLMAFDTTLRFGGFKGT